MAIMNRLVQISPEKCNLVFDVFGSTELMDELTDACSAYPEEYEIKVGENTEINSLNSAAGETADYVKEKHHIEIWIIWPNASYKDECLAKMSAVMDKYPDTVAKMKQYIADNNITFEDTWWETYEPTDADQAWFKTFAG